ncbi:MAG: GGDEF domain-containing protein [Chrysiogenetes bacterium]|nr:GGDEF domain-containing protein [Chrysiogenetes bacterium]
MKAVSTKTQSKPQVTHRVGHVRQWSVARRAAVGAAAVAAANLLWNFGFEIAVHVPGTAAYLNENFAGTYRLWTWGFFLGFSLIALIGLWLDDDQEETGNFPAHLFLQFFAIASTASAYLLGMQTTALWQISFLAAGMAGILLFDMQVVVAGLTSFALLVIAGIVVEQTAVLPAAPLFAKLPTTEGLLATWWQVGQAATSMLMIGTTIGVCGFLVVRSRRQEKLLRKLSNTDDLTRVPNRRHFLDRLESEFDRSRRHGNTLSFVMIDLDFFKAINDEYGHLVGDRVLATIAGVIKSCLRGSDLLGRYGGEEFALMLPETDLKGAIRVAERCRALIEDTQIVVGGTVFFTVTASMGIICSDNPDIRVLDDMIRLSDEALYQAKAAGRNRIVAAQPVAKSAAGNGTHG